MDVIRKEIFCTFVERIFKGQTPADILSPDSIELFNSVVRVVKLSKGEYLQIEGDVSKYWGIVSEGLVRVYYMVGEEEVTEQLVMEGEDFMDYESFFDQVPSRRFIQMLEPTTIFLVPRLECEDMCNKVMDLRNFFRRLTERKLLHLKKETRNSIFKSAKERYENLVERKPGLILRVPSVYIASYLGVTPETLSRIRSNVK